MARGLVGGLAHLVGMSAGQLHRLFDRALAGRAAVQSHSPVAAREDSAPEPDVAVLAAGEIAPIA